MALFCKSSVPFVKDFSVSRAPAIWSSFVSWLKPPYLYLIINAIIITIAASSRLYQNDHVSSTDPTPSDVGYEMKYEQQQMIVVAEEENKAPDFEEKSVVVSGDDAALDVGNYGDAATWTPLQRTDSLEIPTEFDLLAEKEKPLVSARFVHRKPIKASPEGDKKLRVTKPKRHETLENTWKTITEGRAMPLTRHFKKSDTWENHGRHINVDPSPVKKSKTFTDRTNFQLPPVNNSPGTAGKLRKEPSLSQDELNRRVEAFIKKFNDEMRLQRQESLRQYQEMISRGV